MGSNKKLFGASPSKAPPTPQVLQAPEEQPHQPNRLITGVSRLELLFNCLSDEEKIGFLSALPRDLVERSFPELFGDGPRDEEPEASVLNNDVDHRRAEERRACDVTAKIILGDRTSTLNCRVIDISANGCRLKMGNTLHVPKFFHLQFEDSEDVFVGETMWRNLVNAGVRIRK